MIEVRLVSPDSQEEADFLRLPGKLYAKEQLLQNRREEKEQISGQHVLSHYYDLKAFVVYRDGMVRARGVLTLYPEDKSAYLGYFEAYDDLEAVQTLIAAVKSKAALAGKEGILGPVNASFWLGYRMKLSDFDRAPFTGEPHQLSYYPRLWEACGFVVQEYYRSNFYQKIAKEDHQEKLAQRFRLFKEKGYQIGPPKRSHWQTDVTSVFSLLSKVYQHFPLYKAISAKEFSQLFAPFEQALDFSMVQLAYDEDRLIGFLIALPDYGSSVYGSMSFWEKCRFLKTRFRANRYIILYLGIDPAYPGLGKALTYPIYQSIRKRGARTVAALIHQGKLTQGYVPSLQEKTTVYALYHMKIN
ncbi:hypothetical protein AALH12_04450 [Streptococcus ferus]|uniref:hypothetical protein n=1 Tax=Streptococcus ferus TaxID=1345 RepID=UPI0035122209